MWPQLVLIVDQIFSKTHFYTTCLLRFAQIFSKTRFSQKRILFLKTHFLLKNVWDCGVAFLLRYIYVQKLYMCRCSGCLCKVLASYGFKEEEHEPKRCTETCFLKNTLFAQKCLGRFFAYMFRSFTVLHVLVQGMPLNSCCHMVSCQTKVQEHERKHGIHALLCSKRFGFCCGS